MGFVSSFLAATCYCLLVDVGEHFSWLRSMTPAAADDALLHVPEALEFSEWREAELVSRRALAPIQLAGCSGPASLRLVEEKGA